MFENSDLTTTFRVNTGLPVLDYTLSLYMYTHDTYTSGSQEFYTGHVRYTWIFQAKQ